ncbi:MAG: murein biosynthesis integral membrane protein MurJ [Deltaproteobacteria bacterium RBG_16_47_11]|nr:MAG: murein biosynthesis integral membrane protein MurJ [Deltaproteobacteria bacterium RBG_16_47_11]
MSENHKITKAATVIGTGTLLSRILGFFRDMVIANFFGVGMAADAFFMAFRIPNLWRRLVGEGSLTISFIPVYTEYLTQRSEEETRKITHIAFTIAGVILLILTLLGILFSPILIRIIAPGWFTQYPQKFQLTVTLNQIIFPYIFFMGLFALCMGILNSRRHFFSPAIAPIFLNISIIVSVFLFYHTFKIPVMTLALGVLAGGAIQFLFQIPFLWKRGITFRLNFNFRHPAIKRIGLLMIPGLIGTAVYQINNFIDMIFASFLPSGSVSYLFFADRLMEFPLGIFAIAIGMASLPSLSGLASQGKIEELKETLSFTFRLVSFISVPAMVGLIGLKTPIINLLFQRGLFDYSATEKTAFALLFYSAGLWAIAGSRTIVPAFYSLQDTWTPLKIALACLGTNVILNTIFIFFTPLMHGGLALATSLSSMLNLILLFWKLDPKLGGIDLRKNIKSLLRIVLCSLPMGLTAYLICSIGNWSTTGNVGEKALILLTAIVIGLGIYLACSHWMKNEEVLFLLNIVRRKMKR